MTSTRLRRTTAALAIAALSIVVAGCEFSNLGKPPSRSEVGVLIGEDGTPYVGIASCGSMLVSAIDLRYYPDDTLGAPIALQYTFEPPVPRAQALGALDPDVTIVGAERTVFDQEQFDLAMATTKTDDGYPQAYVHVDYTKSNGEATGDGSLWFGDLNAPKSWNQGKQLDKDAAGWECDDEPAWDFSVVSR